MVLWGLPAQDPKPQTIGRQVTAGQRLIVTTDTPNPVNACGPWTERVTTERCETALRVVINSVISRSSGLPVFRSSGQNLTTAGTYMEMASRLAEPAPPGPGGPGCSQPRQTLTTGTRRTRRAPGPTYAQVQDSDARTPR
ncbi:hypothetical protein [Streptomyces chrestomyceticus]|uniref:hypothetical protein n=1 Tax=Streptomyces chrestomyceticus TaxID=68185 RepID=UPI0033D57F1A